MKRKLEVVPNIIFSTNFLPHMGETVIAIKEGVIEASSWYTCFHFNEEPDKARLGLHYEPF